MNGPVFPLDRSVDTGSSVLELPPATGDIAAVTTREVQMVALHFNAAHGFVPHRVTLKEEGFEAALEYYRSVKRPDGRRATLDALYAEAGLNERVARRARKGQTTLPRNVAYKLAEILECDLADIVEVPDPATAPSLHAERCRKELETWSVPLREVPSWVAFVADLITAHRVDAVYGAEVVDLTTAAQIQTFMDHLGFAREQARTAKAFAIAALKDAAADLEASGLHVLFGRYVERTHASPELGQERTAVRFVLVVRIRREAADPAHVVDRSREPLAISDEEDFRWDDNEWWDRCLAWEGKDRLALQRPSEE